jgi:ribonuclease BN (tRNA processing enzyme)
MKIEMLAAKFGDCLLLHGGTAQAPALILIDGGPPGVWKSSLEPRLMQIRKERKLEASKPLAIDLLIISHVDEDHIAGVASMLGAMLERKRAGEPPLFRIDRIWHNSFDNILGNDETVELIKKGKPQFGTASTEEDLEQSLATFEHGEPRDAAFVLASIEQGDNVRRLAKALNIPLNPDFGGHLIATNPGKTATVKIKDLKLTVAGPRIKEVVALQKAHDTWLKNHPERQADADAILAALDDASVANLSSIVLLVESGGKTILLSGDARADKVLAGLEDCKAVVKGGSLPVDILKMPHHGSIRNIDEATIKRLPARRYLFSANGKFSNPDRETFELLFKARPGAEMDLILAYSLQEIDKGRKAEHEKNQKAKSANAPAAWNEAKDGLKALLAPAPQKVRVIESKGISIEVTP